MVKAIRIHRQGGADEMVWEDVALGEPGDGEIRVRHAAIGLNFIDVYHRSGLYPLPDLPVTPGLEAAGVVEAVGPGAGDIAAVARVCDAAPRLGAHSA